MAQSYFVTKTDFDDKLSDLNRKIVSNKEKHLFIENELKKLESFDSSYFRGKSHFENDGSQNWIVFNQYTDILKQLVLTIVIFCHTNLKDCLMKGLMYLLH